MKKYFYVPKKTSIVFFTIFLIIFAVAKYLYNEEIVRISIHSYYNIGNLLLYFLIMLVFGAILTGFIFAYIIKNAGKLYEKACLENHISFRFGRGLIVLQNITGVALVIAFCYIFKSIEKLSKTTRLLGLNIPYVIDQNTKEDMNTVYFGVLAFLCLGAAIFLFVTSARENKVYKLFAGVTERNEKLGFIYEECEFYKQTQIPYESLNHADGTLGEFEIYRRLKEYEGEGVRLVFNREIPKEDGLSTEIDVLLIDKNGIIAIENKDYSGTIYGKANENTWTYIDSKGKKIIIYNPVKQNEGHIKALKAFLEVNEAVDCCTSVHSVVAFTDFKTNKSDEIISRIDMQDSDVKICTSQNLNFIVKKLLKNECKQNVDVEKIYELLIKLPVRKKY